MTTKTILLTGTHHTPDHELIKQLLNDKEVDWNIYCISHLYPTETHLLASILPLLKPNHFFSVDCGKFHRHQPLKTILEIPKIFTATINAVSLIKKIKPDITVSFGGYVSVPVIFASYLQHIPSITHEQTLTLSLSTKIDSIFCRKVALSFDTGHRSSKYVYTGNLLRSEIFSTIPHDPPPPFIYVTGGNHGSEVINNTVLDILPQLTEKYFILHQTGNHLPGRQYPKYFPLKYIDTSTIGYALNRSDIIISRAGANICQEIVALHKKAILIPHPKTQQNEQILNAQWVKSSQPGQTTIIYQQNLTPEVLLQSVLRLAKQPDSSDPVNQEPNLKLLRLIKQIVC